MRKIDNRKDLIWLLPFVVIVIIFFFYEQRKFNKSKISLFKNSHFIEVVNMRVDENRGWVYLNGNHPYQGISCMSKSITEDVEFQELKKELPFYLVKEIGNDTIYIEKESKIYKFLIEEDSK